MKEMDWWPCHIPYMGRLMNLALVKKLFCSNGDVGPKKFVQMMILHVCCIGLFVKFVSLLMHLNGKNLKTPTF